MMEELGCDNDGSDECLSLTATNCNTAHGCNKNIGFEKFLVPKCRKVNWGIELQSSCFLHLIKRLLNNKPVVLTTQICLC